MAIRNKLRNVKMAKANKTALGIFPETETWYLLRPIDTDVVETHNKFSGARIPTVPDDGDVQVPEKNDLSETFDREKLYGKFVSKD